MALLCRGLRFLLRRESTSFRHSFAYSLFFQVRKCAPCRGEHFSLFDVNVMGIEARQRVDQCMQPRTVTELENAGGKPASS